ncbi:MAG: hypothetical protein R3E31_15200 [Chloroflexota bacterium]
MIDFPLNQAAASALLTYRPWGTRTLKVKVSAEQTTPALRIRPRGVRPAEVEAGIFRAFADDSEAFVVSWGGGHENGPCLKAEDFLKAFEKCVPLEPGETSVIFFNVTHVGPDVPETAVLTIEAYDEASGAVFAALPVELRKPQGYGDGVVRWQETAVNQWQPLGDKIPIYDPRWWPLENVSYTAAENLPLLVRREENTLSVVWDGQVVATITDDTQPTILDMDAVSFELFQYDEWHVALRAWFFWLDANIGGGFFIGRHEVPDAERFDMLIRTRDGKVTLACTDLHWREVWGEKFATEPLQATLGLSRETKIKLAQEEMTKAWQELWADKEPVAVANEVYNPNIDYIPRLAMRHGKTTLKKKGTEAHLPMIHNVTQSEPARFTSSDVRLG